jgi:hypothetical protein
MLSALCLANVGALPVSWNVEGSAEPNAQLQPTSEMAIGIDSRPAKQLVWWLHIPKCGTSFASSAHLYAEDPSHKHACCGPNHKRLPADVSASSLANVVAMFREPKQRAASAYYYLKHMSTPRKDKCCTGDWGWEKQTFRPIRKQIRNGASFNATLSGFVGCQTNMVLGYGCMAVPEYHETRDHPRHIAERAVKRMESFKFVGLESEWLLSICLFNFKMTGERFVTGHQVGFLMPGKGKHTDGKTKSYTKYDVTGYPDDPFDDVLYAAVKERFDKEVAALGISDGACPFIESHDAQRRWHLRVGTPDSDSPAPDDHNSSLVGGAEDAWVDAEAVSRFGIKLEDPSLESGPGRRAIWQGHPS